MHELRNIFLPNMYMSSATVVKGGNHGYTLAPSTCCHKGFFEHPKQGQAMKAREEAAVSQSTLCTSAGTMLWSAIQNSVLETLPYVLLNLDVRSHSSADVEIHKRYIVGIVDQYKWF